MIKNLFFKHFGNDILLRMEDAAVLTMKSEKIAFTTDSFTVSPLFFKGGNIGKLAIAGTVNDLSMMGARPKYLTCAFMIEEGFEYEKLEEIVISMRDEMAKSGVKIVAGDTKVVPKGGVDGVFINTAGVGEVLKEGISAHALRQGDAIIVTNEVGNHGACILAMREELELQSDLKTDCASLWKSVEALIDADIEIHALRDATRGGVSAVLNEWAQTSNVGIHVREADIPVANEVKGMCELLGFEPYEFANEGTMLIALPQSEVAKALEVLKRFEETSKSTLIGDVDDRFEGRVVLQTPWDSERFLEPPKGELLPRIC
nr:hydrogenase expression/formation protein HypE [Sulfurospirillum sp. DNRA8]